MTPAQFGTEVGSVASYIDKHTHHNARSGAFVLTRQWLQMYRFKDHPHLIDQPHRDTYTRLLASAALDLLRHQHAFTEYTRARKQLEDEERELASQTAQHQTQQSH